MTAEITKALNTPKIKETWESNGTAIPTLTGPAFGKFVAAIPPPLGIGTIGLADGRAVKGFLVEAAAINNARDISAFGGWRAFMENAGTTI